MHSLVLRWLLGMMAPYVSTRSMQAAAVAGHDGTTSIYILYAMRAGPYR